MCAINLHQWSPHPYMYLPCKAKRQYLLTCKLSRYCLLTLQSSVIFIQPEAGWRMMNFQTALSESVFSPETRMPVGTIFWFRARNCITTPLKSLNSWNDSYINDKADWWLAGKSLNKKWNARSILEGHSAWPGKTQINLDAKWDYVDVLSGQWKYLHVLLVDHNILSL